MTLYDLKTFIDEIYETSGVANKHDSEITLITTGKRIIAATARMA
jgi:hypothetical protein